MKIKLGTNHVLIVAIALTGGASFACTFAFLYTFLNGGLAGFVAGMVGIGTQLFAYALPLRGFSLLNQRKVFVGPAVLLCGMVPALFSILATVGTLQASAETGKNVFLSDKEHREQQAKALSQLNRQIDTFTLNAEQGVESNYRTQAKQNLNDSQWHLQQKLALLPSLSAPQMNVGKLEALLGTITSAIPSVGTTEQLQRTLVVTLAVFFDLLPVIGMALIARTQPVSEPPQRSEPTPEQDWFKDARAAVEAGEATTSIRSIKALAGVGEPKAKQFIAWLKEQEATA